MDIVKLMAEYNLTLRHVPDFEVSFHIARENEQLKENQEFVIWDTWKDGIPRKMVKTSKPRKFSEWLCIQNNGFGEMQSFAGCFYGSTAEEAVNNCVTYLKSKKNGNKDN